MTLSKIIKKYRFRLSITLFLVLLEGALGILFPLFIGYAINGALENNFRGAMLLGGLGLVSLIIGAARRLFDSRFYAKVYREMGFDIGSAKKIDASQKTARLSMLNEVVEFFENSIPEIITSIIGLVGTLIIVATLNDKIFYGCLMILLVVFIVYAITRRRTIHFNASYNNTLEEQVNVLGQESPPQLKSYLKNLMK